MIRKKLTHSCQACQFSPFDLNLIGVATSKTFGLVGPGELSILRYSSDNTSIKGAPQTHQQISLVEIMTCSAKDSVIDLVWSETLDSIILAALGDGSISIYNLRPSDGFFRKNVEPFKYLNGHKQEVSSLNWNLQFKHLVASASWDSSIVLWDMNTLDNVLAITNTHTGPIFQATFSPREPNLLASVGTDLKLAISDIRISQTMRHNKGNLSCKLIHSCIAHEHKALCLDWNKYNSFEIATGAADGTIRLWDIRQLYSNSMPNQPTLGIQGHQLAVRRVKFDPFREHIFATSSYDRSVKLWNKMLSQPSPLPHNPRMTIGENKFAELGYFCHHTEFILGLDWSLFKENLIASASWDKTVCLFYAHI